MTHGDRDPARGQALAGDWRARIAERLRARGHASVTEMVESTPTKPLIAIADELSVDDTGRNRSDVAAVSLAELWREEAIARGPEAIERLARRAYVGEVHRQVPEGWVPRKGTLAGASWSGILGRRWRTTGMAVMREL